MIKRLPWSEPLLDHMPPFGEQANLLCSTVDVTEQELNSGQPIILFEKRDGANIARRDLLKHPNVKKYVKQYAYRDQKLNNRACVGGRYFTRFIAEEKDWEEVEQLEKKDMDKITTGWNFLHYTRNQKFVQRAPDWEEKKTVDVFFAGTTDYKNGEGVAGHLISRHRKTCVEAIKTAFNRLKGITIRVADSRALNPMEYEETMYASKVVVSPWGWGESCYRDYEALLAGCIVIKPRSDFVLSDPDIYTSDYFITCDPFWSDLEDKIVEGLKLSNDVELLKLHRQSILPFTGKQYLRELIKRLCEF